MRVFKILTLVFLSLFYFANRAVSRAETNDIIHFDYNFTNILSESIGSTVFIWSVCKTPVEILYGIEKDIGEPSSF